MEISFTKLRLFRECPWKYKLRMVDGRRVALTPAASLGLSLHRALECFHRKEAPAAEYLWECFEGRWLASGYPDEKTRQSWRAKGRRILERYLEDDRERRSVVAAVEREFLYPLGRHEVRGTIDRIDRHPDGRIEVIDYKTFGAGEKLDDNDELQLRFYGLGAFESLALAPSILTLYFVASGRKVSLAHDAGAQESLKSIILESAQRIEAGAFPPDASHCPACDFRTTCAHSSAP
ncbi:MAG TPA: hypothetical protein DEB40_01235 [Elusimicrobia bacterium]|nr:hypothetical protein [Elusimicrobiota bacterium]HBT60353.1 hypothetical protein [Elusimicrobiota bacterium]